MAIPIPLPINASIIDRLFAQMPQGFSRNQAPIDSLVFFVAHDPNGTNLAYGTIQDGIFSITSPDDSIDNEIIELKNYTIKSLQKYFQEKYSLNNNKGLYVSIDQNLSDTYQNKSALCLLEGSLNFSEIPISWPQFTTNNYILVSAIAAILKDHQKNMKNALLQTDLHLASKEWLDHWGTVLGVKRISAEIYSDNFYRNRIQRESVFPKSNNFSISSMLEWATGLTASVVDGGQPFFLGPGEAPLLSVEHVSGQGVSSTDSFLAIGSKSTGAAFSASSDGFQVINTYQIFDLGPSTGAGKFIVQISGDKDDGTLSASMRAYIYALVNKYKPAGIPFSIQVMV